MLHCVLTTNYLLISSEVLKMTANGGFWTDKIQFEFVLHQFFANPIKLTNDMQTIGCGNCSMIDGFQWIEPANKINQTRIFMKCNIYRVTVWAWWWYYRKWLIRREVVSFDSLKGQSKMAPSWKTKLKQNNCKIYCQDA